MSQIALQSGDVLAARADAILIPIDGTSVPREGQFERLLGNVGRQFNRRFPEADLLEALESQVDFPLALGRASPVELEDSPFKHAIVVSTLHHVDHLDHSAKCALVRTSLLTALTTTGTLGLASLASPVLQGGWRLRPEDAFTAMLTALDAGTDVQLVVRCIDQELYDRLRVLARSLGLAE